MAMVTAMAMVTVVMGVMAGRDEMEPQKKNELTANWDLEIDSGYSLFNLRLREIWAYRDLILLLVKRDIVAQYKQTILGPAWHIIQPLITTAMYTFIFGNFAKIPTDGSPGPVFYLSGIVIWYFFAGSFSGTSNTFVANAGIFGKIYFPRMVVPISTTISNIIRFGIQFLIFIAVMFWFLVKGQVHLTSAAFLLPVLIIIISLLGMGCGIVVSSLTTRYRDLTFFLAFGLQLWMYLTPIIYPSTLWGKYQWILYLNPMTAIVETFRYGFLGTGSFNILWLMYSAAFPIVIFMLGAVLFNRVEKSFMDTV